MYRTTNQALIYILKKKLKNRKTELCLSLYNSYITGSFGTFWIGTFQLKKLFDSDLHLFHTKECFQKNGRVVGKDFPFLLVLALSSIITTTTIIES
jgi:hypothetical protein